MVKQNFKIIKGGADGTSITISKEKVFVSAYVTDTRLMGVVTLCIHWEASTDAEGWDDFYQFFYFDAEEYGLDTYESLRGMDPSALEKIEQNLMGGLGGEKKSVSRKEAIFLLQSFVADSKVLNVPLPDPVAEYDDLLKEHVKLSEWEESALTNKICTPILSDYQLIHYYLMRCFAKDKKGATYLIGGDFDPLEPSGINAATLCKNTIEEHINENGTISYLCEAVLDEDGKYELAVLEITVSNAKITSVYRQSSFRISSTEAAMMLNRPEFVSVYEILSDPVGFDEKFVPMMSSTMQTNHDNGRLFMEFNKNNDHVNQKVFSLNEDVHGLYYISDYGQLIIAAYGLEEIHSMEKSLQRSPISLLLLPTAKYEFKEPVVYDFILSEFEDFEDFILSMQ